LFTFDDKIYKTMMDCLKNIVGVTKLNCNCVVDDLDAETKAKLAASNSGLYLDDLPGGVELRALNNIDTCQKMAVFALNALEVAANTVEADLKVAISNLYSKGANAYRGLIGQQSYAQTLEVTRKYQGILLRAQDGVDGIAIINRIMIIVNGAENITLKVYRAPRFSALGQEVATYDVQTISNNYTFVSMAAPLKLPLTINGQPQDYYFIYDSKVGANVYPKDCKIDCGCAPGVTTAISTYIKPIGIQLDDLDNLNGALTDKYTRGILLDADLKCDTAQLVCGQYDKDEAVAVVMAYATQFKAGELLIEDVLKSNEVNRFTLQDNQYLWGKRNHFRSEYSQRITYLASAIDITQTNCFVCKDQIYMSRTNITDGGQANISEAENAAQDFNLNPVVPGVIDYPNNY
jgi:hypothetical protein